jgi:TonB family protein
MREPWKTWEGRVVHKEFRLGDCLGGSETAGVFATEYGPDSQKAAVKLIPTGTWDSATIKAEFARLQSARELRHPHLLPILQAGRTTVDDIELLYVVMEQADEDLSQILPSRALTEGEVREMLPPILEALAYLHAKGFVHGHVKPANVMAAGDQLKLSSDGIRAFGARPPASEISNFGAPELSQGDVSASADIWGLGTLLVMALTQHTPAWDARREEPLLPENLPAPFDEIARHCLRRDPRERWELAEIAGRAGIALALPAAKAVAVASEVTQQRQNSISNNAAAAHAGKPVVGDRSSRTTMREPAASRPSLVSKPQRAAEKRSSHAGIYVSLAAALVIALVIFVPRLFRSAQAPPEVQKSQGEIARKDSARVAKPKTRAVKVADAGARNENGTRATAQAIAETGNPPSLSAARETTPRSGPIAGHPSDQVIPNVPESARKTIHGTVRVGVRVSVDSSGEVTEAEFDSAGPSKYFAQLALNAAQQWKFDPPKMQGRNVLSDWLLQFQFTQKGTKVIPTQSDP